jgi:GT2 family glycosyltransferase
MSRRKATLIVLAWNRWDLTRRCLDSLQATDRTGAEVIVVDNGSTDETPQALSGYPWVRVIRNPRNLGFVRGNNVGIAEADPDSDVVLLNNDVELPQRDWLQRLRDCAHETPKAGIVGCRLVLSDGRLLHAGTYILPETMWGQQIGSLERDVGQYANTREVEGIVFACAYIRREVLTAIGPLSVDFESYFEDTDYCLQASRAGFKTFVCGGVTLVHDEHGSTTGDDGRFMRIFQASRAVFRKKWGKALEGRYTRELLWQSIMNFPTGYAMSTREILRALDRRGVRVRYRYVYGPGTPYPPTETDSSGDYLMNVIASRNGASLPSVGVVYGQGDVFRRNRARRKVGFTMIEVDGFPADWVRQANRMDEVWVPSEFNRQGFVASGVKRPIHRIPLGVDPNYFHPGIRGVPNPNGEFVFLSNFEWGERKEPWLLLKVFNDEFKADEPVRLVCKIINKDPEVHVRREIANLRLKESGGKISFLFNREFPYYQLGAFYRSADCFISAGRGEGWDMPLMEAMVCGLPAIATDWGAHTEFVHEGNAYPLRIRKTIPAVAKCPYYEGFRWADPDPEHLRVLLREVYDDREEARRRGMAAAREMAERWTWDHTAEKIMARLDALAG